MCLIFVNTFEQKRSLLCEKHPGVSQNALIRILRNKLICLHKTWYIYFSHCTIALPVVKKINYSKLLLHYKQKSIYFEVFMCKPHLSVVDSLLFN